MPELVFPNLAPIPTVESTTDLVTAIEEWSSENSPATAYPPLELRTQQQDFPPLYEALPTVSAKIVDDAELDTSEQFPTHGYQQMHLQVVSAELMILAEAEPAWTANEALYGIVDGLKAALKSDGTMGGRVQSASRLYRVTYDGEVQYEDGTVCRMATFRVSVAQRVEVV